MGDYVNASQTHSVVLEAYYGIPVMAGLVIMLEFECMMRPGEASVVPNASLTGLKAISVL